MNWFRSYFRNRYSSVRIFGDFSSPSAVSSDVPQGSVLDLCFNTFINVICNVIRYSRHLLFAHDIRMFRAANSADDCTLLHADIEHTQAWCAANCMKLNISNARVITFSRKTNVLYYSVYTYHQRLTTLYNTYFLMSRSTRFDASIHHLQELHTR